MFKTPKSLRNYNLIIFQMNNYRQKFFLKLLDIITIYRINIYNTVNTKFLVTKEKFALDIRLNL